METYPVTQMQEQLWAVQNLFPQSPLYNTAWRFEICSVDVQRFGKAFEQLVKRHDALRTVIDTIEGEPVPRILEQLAGTFEIIFVDSPEHATAAIEGRSRHLLDITRKTVDSVLFVTKEGAATWFLNLHHIVNDGASSIVLFSDMAKLYEGQAEEKTASFQELALSDQARNAEEDLAFWKAWRESAPAVPSLYGTTLTGTNVTAIERRVHLNDIQLGQLTGLSHRKEFASLNPQQAVFSLFQTAMVSWLHRISNESHLSLGVATHGRHTPLHRNVAGCFVGIFPVDIKIAPTDTFTTLHAKLRRQNMRSLGHAVPGAFRSNGKSHYSAVINAFPVHFPTFDGGEVKATWLGNGCIDPTHAVRLNVISDTKTGKVTLKFLFNDEVVPEAQADDAVQHLMTLMTAFAENPDQKIESVPIAGRNEASFALTDRTPEGADAVEDILEAFQRLTASDPDAHVITDDTRNWTRVQLMARTDAIAEQLLCQDIGSRDRVGVHLTRSGDLVAALLAIWKTGAAFVPLDPTQPHARLDVIASEADLGLILTETATKRDWSATIPVSLVDDIPTAGAEVQANPVPGPAYVLFTSGSTGVPKGVEVGRPAISRYAAWAQTTHAGASTASWALHSALGFDLTLTSIFAPIATGGTIRAYREKDDGPDLSVLRVFEDDAVEVVKLTPRHLTMALEAAKPLKSIRSLVLGGEALTTSLARNALLKFGDRVQVHNEYGPTEAVIGCMDHIFDPEKDTDATVPIGRPAAATQITIRDAGLNPVADRVIGELFVSGKDRLANGYFNQTDADTFMTDPTTGTRMYRTGDLASVRPDGVVLYHGRKDDQVKVSGIRIELGEISNAVLAQDGITDCAVTLFDPNTRPERHCPTCGISDRVPDVPFQDDGTCQLCHDFFRFRAHAADYFRDVSDLPEVIAKAAAKKTGDYDCVILLSGGKDSTYAVARMAEITTNMLCVTLDNGYIAEEAKANIQRITNLLGLDHRFLTTPVMNDIFVDSLKRHSNVCQGCFKTIYTLALDVAREVGAPMIVTGLSRGQLFETRLAPELFNDKPASPTSIDDIVLEARKTYHAYPDAVTRNLNGDLFDTGDILNEIEFLDFYRYCDVPVSEVFRYLKERVGWVRPSDTGRSSNCLINDVGIFVHKTQRHHHNYALPYSWDVRMGHKTVAECRDELDDEIDETYVHRILGEIGYDISDEEKKGGDLTCYFVTNTGVTADTLRMALAKRLPREVIPRHFVAVDKIPLTANGKIDAAKLPDPRKSSSKIFVAPETQVSSLAGQMLAIWQTVLRDAAIGPDDNFYDIGGSSIAAIQIAARARGEGIEISPIDIFRAQTVSALMAAVPATEQPTEHMKSKIPKSDAAKLSQLLGAKIGD